MALRASQRLLSGAINAKYHSMLYHYFRVANHHQGSSMNTWEVYDQTGGHKYIVDLKVQSTQDGQVDAAQPAMIQWYGFKMVHPTVVGQFMDLTDCVLCGSCTAACPSYWWNNDIFLGPAAMVQAWRWLWEQHNDKETFERKVKQLTNGTISAEFCHNIGNCVQVCPKNIQVDRVMNSFKILGSLN
jgi:succinate dehydrogenase/fumarate reductase-like Fe-S protein|uniref:4Fe-4S ferredoxin-type domain-containing protein n=2 Tax=Eutreptiella gymnastica TaxID=73025 RepID=A0A7S4FEI2_9EUGL